MKTFSTLAIAVIALFSFENAEAQVIGHSGKDWSIKGTNPIQIYFGDKLVTAYNAGKEEGKPFFYPVIGPTGENMTRHWPMNDEHKDEAQDHIHHRGMWYGLGNVNGFDFWHFHADSHKRDKAFGAIIHKSLNGVSKKDGEISITTKSDWVEQKKPGQKICSDKRVFTFSNGADKSLIVDAEITLIADSGEVTINDDKEGAWSIRTLPSLRLEGDFAKGAIVNNNGLTGKDAWGKRAKWVDYFGPDRAGNSVGIAIMDHPKNPRYPTWWHARHYGLFTANPFGQSHFEKGSPENLGKFVIKEGESVTFRYRTIFHKGNPTEAKIADAFGAFSGE